MKPTIVSSAVVSSLAVAHGTTWAEHDATRCTSGHGARNLDPAGSSYKDDISVDECKTACSSTHDCTAVQYLTASGGTSCYRLADLRLPNCTTGDPHWTLYSLASSWEAYPTYHCLTGHGARDLDSGSSFKDDISLAECEQACTMRLDCTGVQFLQASGGTSCYHVADVILNECEVGDAQWSTFLRPDVSGFVPHVGYNCSQDHGARDLDAGGQFGNSSITKEACEGGCMSIPDCIAVRYLRANGGSLCNRLADVDLNKCLTGDSHWTTYTRLANPQTIVV